MFREIQLSTWRQFENIKIEFHPRLTILTGANGSGKTTILNLLNRHFGWPLQLVGTPERDLTTGIMKYLTGFWSSLLDRSKDSKELVVGKIIYSDGKETKLLLPRDVGSIYEISFPQQQGIRGFFIPSHRPTFKYEQVGNIPTNLISKIQAFQTYSNSIRERYFGAGSSRENFFIKQTLISLASLGYGNNVVVRNDAAVSIFEGFERILILVLPPKLGFKRISIRLPEVVLETQSGDFSIDAVSGGIAAVIDLAWQIYMYDDGHNPFVVTFDEPENHLHPEMQKTLLPNFIKAFPRVQFVVASHNPFIISSVADSNVFILNYNETGKVYSIFLNTLEKSGTANDILTEVLGVESTAPDWVNTKIDNLLEKYLKNGLTKENIGNFKAELKGTGLDKYILDSIGNLVERSKSNDKVK
jgi:energy-coupling factor transporter ATP-binding protein EcfA2